MGKFFKTAVRTKLPNKMHQLALKALEHANTAKNPADFKKGLTLADKYTLKNLLLRRDEQVAKGILIKDSPEYDRVNHIISTMKKSMMKK